MGLCPFIMLANIVVSHDFAFAANIVWGRVVSKRVYSRSCLSSNVAVHRQRPAKDHKLGKKSIFQQLNLA
jgi:hypothetical protein